MATLKGELRRCPRISTRRIPPALKRREHLVFEVQDRFMIRGLLRYDISAR